VNRRSGLGIAADLPCARASSASPITNLAYLVVDGSWQPPGVASRLDVVVADAVSDGQRRPGWRLAAGTAERIELELGPARPGHVAVWGSLLVSGAVAAAREERRAAVRLDAAGPTARQDYETWFRLPQVIMHAVDVTVVRNQPARALDIARRMPPEAPLPLAVKAWHMADKASAQTAIGRDREAVDTLLGIGRDASNWA